MVARRRIKRSSRHGLTAYRVFELLTGEMQYPVSGYSGYGQPSPSAQSNRAESYISDAMERDWEIYGPALTRFWQSGAYTTTEALAAFGIDVRMRPWLFAAGGPDAVPWAEDQFGSKRCASRHSDGA